MTAPRADDNSAAPTTSGSSGADKAVARHQDPTDDPQAADHGQPDRSEEGQIPPDSLRLDPRVGEELYGANFSASYSHVRASGVNAFGNHNTIHYVTFQGQPTAKPVIRPLPAVQGLLPIYAETAADGRLLDVLRERSTACVAGRPNTGRFSTACVALARRHSADRVHEVLLPEEVGPEALRLAADTISTDHGYVLRLPGDRHVEAMRLLAEVFQQRSASLVLIRDDDSRLSCRHSAEVLHCAPDPVAVFRRHLTHHLGDRAGLGGEQSGRHVEAYLRHEGLVRAVESTYGPREVLPIATAVAQHHPADHETLDEIVEMSQPRRRALAAKILNCDAAGATRRPRRADQHERAFRIAYAVFAWQPLHYVFEAAGLLLKEIDGQANRPDWGRMALQHPVSALLGPLDVDWQEGREAARAPGGVSRSAWLHDGAMRGAIIDEAWHEFDGTRPAILAWLDILVASDDEPVRRAASEAAGLLAHHDFDRVCAELIDGWASAPRPRTREAAARAIVVADMGGHVHHLVRGKVRDWAGGHRNYQRDAAALVYASGLQQPDLSWSLSDLRRIAEDRMQQNTFAVAESIRQIYQRSPERVEEIIAELTHWSNDRRLKRQAGNALLTLAEQTDDDAPGRPPALMMNLAANQVDAADLTRLWQTALLTTDALRQPTAWDIFGQWLRSADSDETFRKAITALVSDLVAVATLRNRLRFHLLRLPGIGDGLPEWLENAMKEL